MCSFVFFVVTFVVATRRSIEILRNEYTFLQRSLASSCGGHGIPVGSIVERRHAKAIRGAGRIGKDDAS